MILTTEHIDPRNGVLVCGLENSFNEIIAENEYNAGKQNRFVPYRVKDYSAPITYGDIGEFLIDGEWLVCEFGGSEWKEETRRVGFGSMDAWKIIKERGIAIFGMSEEEHFAASSQGGTTSWEEKRGWFACSEEEAQERRSRAGKKAVELGVGIHGRTPEQHSVDSRNAGKSAMKQRWKCTVTGFISTAANLKRWQVRRGIDPTLRERVE
jgi:hypothetical protein